MNGKSLAIIGAGPAGLTAAVYGARAGMDVSVYDGGIVGSQVALSSEIENFPGIDFITGRDLASGLRAQAESHGVKFHGKYVTEINLSDRGVELELCGNGGKYDAPSGRARADALVWAVGVKRRKLGCTGEEELAGKGVSYCATCDGGFFKGKTVAVAGGGNTALEDALYLANICEKVYVIHRRDTFKAEQVLIDSVMKTKNIETFMSADIVKIDDNQTDSASDVNVASVVISLNGKNISLDIDAIFIAIGMEPDNAVLFNSGAAVSDESGYVVSDETCRTRSPRVFAAGDCRAKQHRQIITAAADGAVAAMNAVEYLTESTE